jgi:uncharacterized protein (DUF1810 family)
MTDDPHDLARFVDAQAGSFSRALAELRAGRKTSHWSWYVFPQVAGLGHSPMSVRYAIRSREEALAFLAHPVLGPRLREVVAVMNGHAGRDASDILGAVDALKFRSCVTLFGAVAPHEGEWALALDTFFGGEADAETLRRLGP